MADCEKCRDLFDHLLSGRLSEEEQGFCNEHLQQCVNCREDLEDYRRLDELLQQWTADEVAPPAQFHQQLMENLRMQCGKPVSPMQQWWQQHGKKFVPLVAAAVLMIGLIPPSLHYFDKTNAPLPQLSLSVEDNQQEELPATLAVDDEQQQIAVQEPQEAVVEQPIPEQAPSSVAQSPTVALVEEQPVVVDEGQLVLGAVESPTGGNSKSRMASWEDETIVEDPNDVVFSAPMVDKSQLEQQIVEMTQRLEESQKRITVLLEIDDSKLTAQQRSELEQLQIDSQHLKKEMALLEEKIQLLE